MPKSPESYTKMNVHFLIFCCLFTASVAVAQPTEIPLRQGLVITQSCRVKPGAYLLDAPRPATFSDTADTRVLQPVVTIQGDNISVDFAGATLRSNADPKRPDRFTGLAVLVRGKNVTLKNMAVQGFKVALLAEDADGLKLENSDFSYNYRPRLYSIREHENFADWLSYHHNERDEWMRYGAGIYLKNCDSVLVKGCSATGNQNALLMTGCNGGLVYNNTFHFNSGLGIGLYRSSGNRIMHNRLDWNVRGYSHGFYQRGQDSAALLCYEQSSNNLFAFNSCTHSGDGFFLWAGQHTMDTGEGGCNDNLIFGNDFSHAPTNGIEVTFSRNQIRGNLIRECTYGIWGGYSYESLIMGNYIGDCKTGIAIEHGQQDTILQNYFEGDSTGIQLWARASQPADWIYAQKRDTRSRDALIDRNVFMRVRKPLKISNSKDININGVNLFTGFQTLLETAQPNENLRFVRNDIYGSKAQVESVWAHPELAAFRSINFSHPEKQPQNPYAPLDITYAELRETDSLPDGMFAGLPPDQLRGRQYILMDEWGPCDFKRPYAALGEVSPVLGEPGAFYHVLKIYGPPGKWKIADKTGIANVDQSSGTVPAFITLKSAPGAENIRLVFEYTGEQHFTGAFGEKYKAGEPYRFAFERFEKKLNWTVQFFNYDSLPPAAAPDGAPVAEKNAEELHFAWWDSPAPGINADRFFTVSTATFDIAPGRYLLELTSDDGARLYLDGKRLIDHWDVHEPAVDEVPVTLGGAHTLRVEHFDAGGFSTLGLRIRPLED